MALILDEFPCQDLCTIHHAISNLYERVRRSGDKTLEDFWNNLVLGRERDGSGDMKPSFIIIL